MNPPAPADLSGQLLVDKYQLVRLLGSGGMGSVYEARNTWTKRRVAIKFLRHELASDKEAVQRFRLEAQAASAIAHPHIVDILDMGRDAQGTFFIVQEYLSGATLRQHLTDCGALGLAEAIDIAVPIMGALAASHENGILHRDVKPENIFLLQNTTGRPFPKLIDFGISKVVNGASGSAPETTSGAALGTPRYMAPEQLNGMRIIDARTDVWSMGTVVYEMLSGRSPFEGLGLFEIVRQILAASLVRLHDIAPLVPTDLSDVVHRALEPELERRYPSMRAFLEGLLTCPSLGATSPDQSLARRHQEALNPRRIVTLSSSTPEAAGPPPVGGDAEPEGVAVEAREGGSAEVATRERARPPRPPSRRPWLMGGAALLVAGTAAVAWVAQRGPGPAPAVTAGAAAARDGGARPSGPTDDLARAAIPAAPVVPAAAALAAPAEPATATLRIDSTPDGADVYRFADGVLIGKTPFEQQVTRTAGIAVFLVKTSGHLDEQVRMPTDRDGSRSVSLKPLRRGGSRAGKPKIRKPVE